jgi:hypothetical protein
MSAKDGKQEPRDPSEWVPRYFFEDSPERLADESWTYAKRCGTSTHTDKKSGIEMHEAGGGFRVIRKTIEE